MEIFIKKYKIWIISLVIILLIIYIILYIIPYFRENYQNISTKYYISTRTDGYGANSIPYISYLYLSNMNNKELYHNCNKSCDRYKDNIIHKYLVSNSKQTNNTQIINNDINMNQNMYWSPAYICKDIYKQTGEVFPDIFYKSKIFNELRNLYISKYKNKNNTDIQESTIIHVRLGDVYDNPNGDLQDFIGEQDLILIINYVIDKFKNPLYLMTKFDFFEGDKEMYDNRDKQICLNCLKKSNFVTNDYNKHILGSDDMDYDIYLMMICKNLIISRSTFSFIPAILQKNVVYSYEDWRHFEDLKGSNKESRKIKLLKYK